MVKKDFPKELLKAQCRAYRLADPGSIAGAEGARATTVNSVAKVPDSKLGAGGN